MCACSSSEVNNYPAPLDVGFRVRGLDRGEGVNIPRAWKFYSASCICTSENSSSTHFVNKGKGASKLRLQVTNVSEALGKEDVPKDLLSKH